jgi:acetoin utilization deacetylase AcuC-like enzyme
MKQIEPASIDERLMRSVHSDQYIELLQLTAKQAGMVRIDPDTYALPISYEIARLSAGGVVCTVDHVLRGEANNGLAVVRPPGHHATINRGMGFCLLSNIAIAARHAQFAHHIERILILDYDVHHGNGTQDVFYEDKSVFYPGTGTLIETGEGEGSGYTLNIPLGPGSGDRNYMRLFDEVIWPAVKRFRPQLILVSAGFDAHWTDPLAMMKLSLSGYAHITRELIRMADELCDGKIVFVTEGGYDLNALRHGVRNIAHALLGEDETSDPLGAGNNPHEPDLTRLVSQLHQLHTL